MPIVARFERETSLSRDGDRRGQAVDPLGGRLIEPLQKLPRVERKALDIPPLPLGIERVERQARFAASADAAEHDQLVLRNVEIDMLQIVDGNAAQFDVPSSRTALSWPRFCARAESRILPLAIAARQCGVGRCYN